MSSPLNQQQTTWNRRLQIGLKKTRTAFRRNRQLFLGAVLLIFACVTIIGLVNKTIIPKNFEVIKQEIIEKRELEDDRIPPLVIVERRNEEVVRGYDDNRQAVANERKDIFGHVRLNGSRDIRFEGRKDVFEGVQKDRMHGKIGVDEKGMATWTVKPLTFKMSMEQKREANKGYCFNTRKSQAIELGRSLPDYNRAKCRAVEYDMNTLGVADVIIVFHNEDLSVLLRTIHSILNRAPPKLLGEIILVDDNSNLTTHPWLEEHELAKHLKYLPKTVLRRLEERHGLMRARMSGVELAKSDVLVFLDSHIECMQRWLEPMLDEIRRDPKRVVTPLIHTLDADTLEPEDHAVAAVGFSWSLGQTHPYRKTNHFDPISSPVMAGGLFAIKREWFIELGGYDPEMRLYGGEEMEIGFKVWMCGGSLYALPCSRIGHIFRTDKYWKGQVYTVPMDEIIRNKIRTAEVWLDEYKNIAFLAMSELPPDMDDGPYEEVKAIRERLNCKSFSWYLENVSPETWVPKITDLDKQGSVNNLGMNACLDNLGQRESGPMGVYPCHGMHGSQAFLLDGKTFRSASASFEGCMKVLDDDTFFIQIDANYCSNPDKKASWDIINPSTRSNQMPIHKFQRRKNRRNSLPETVTPIMIQQTSTDKCLEASNDKQGELSPISLKLKLCDENNDLQIWAWVP